MGIRLAAAILCEDEAQFRLIRELVLRRFREKNAGERELSVDRPSARGSGVSEVFKMYLKAVSKDITLRYDLYVLAKDGNKKGYAKIRKDFEEALSKDFGDRGGYPFPLVMAIPDPHVERWYLLDQKALQKASGAAGAPDLPPLSKRKDYYKRMLREYLGDNGIRPQFGGAEYGEDIAAAMDIELAMTRDDSFKRFIEDLDGAVAELAAMSRQEK